MIEMWVVLGISVLPSVFGASFGVGLLIVDVYFVLSQCFLP